MKIADMPGSSLERADWSEVRGFSHEMKYPFDMREAKGRGEPEHGACTVLKELDKASPKLYEALAKKKKINSVEIEFERDKPGEGATEVYFKITLSDCRLIYARPHIPGPGERDENTPPHMDQIGFAYRKIDWEWLSGGKLPTTFDFSAPQS
ncbi:MAG: type VI secretion system tube protein Hcp [Planctomycetota bacterium]